MTTEGADVDHHKPLQSENPDTVERGDLFILEVEGAPTVLEDDDEDKTEYYRAVIEDYGTPQGKDTTLMLVSESKGEIWSKRSPPFKEGKHTPQEIFEKEWKNFGPWDDVDYKFYKSYELSILLNIQPGEEEEAMTDA